MKVYFVGSHSVGKTTLARYVSDKYHLPTITEVARMVLSEKEWQVDTLRYDIRLVDEYQTQIFYRQLQEETKQTSFVSDRSALDCLAYAANHARVLPELLASPQLPSYLSILKEPDSILFFVRPSRATLKADGVREAIDWDGIVAVDAMVKLMLEMWSLRYYAVSMDNMQERIRLIDGVLGTHKAY